MDKILVCITIQENSKRLIEKGAAIANETGGELHLLNIRKGDTIFDTPSNSSLFEELFAYGSELGAQAHFICSKDVKQTIFDFISCNEITHLVLGCTPSNTPGSANVYEALHTQLRDVNITVLDRDVSLL